MIDRHYITRQATTSCRWIVCAGFVLAGMLAYVGYHFLYYACLGASGSGCW